MSTSDGASLRPREGGRRPTYHLSSALFQRLIGLVYLFAFLSLSAQIVGLVGEGGLLPAADFLAHLEAANQRQDEPIALGWQVPTLAWLGASDGALFALGATGCVLSVLLIFGVAPLPTLFGLWLLYLSSIWMGQTFMTFQWDILLVEAGFLALWLAPATARSRWFGDAHPPRLALWLIWWLLFRLMFESGVVKLTWDDPYPAGALGPGGNTWEKLTALTYHYWTQPLPLPTSWFVAKLPVWIQKASVIGVFVIELALPFCVLGPRQLRRLACAGFTLLMGLISATGNYNFFNLLTVVLALTLLDDEVWPRALRARISASPSPPTPILQRSRQLTLIAFAALVAVISVPQLWRSISPPAPGRPAPRLEQRLGISQFFLVNSYGLFRSMTETRPEIVIEGRRGGADWQPYEFRWKPGDPARRPRATGPHQPRLDWQMWFEALSLERAHALTGTLDARHMSPWFRNLLQRLVEAEPTVLALLEHDPFAGERPRALRVSLYQYRFTTTAEKRATGRWWHRELVWRAEATLTGAHC